MDIFNLMGNFFNGGIGQVVAITIGGGVSAWVANEIRKFLSSVKNEIIRKIKGQVATIEDENLRIAARHVVRYVASLLPNSSSDEKMSFAIKKMQEITPDILVSDEKVKVLIESSYFDFKEELKMV